MIPSGPGTCGHEPLWSSPRFLYSSMSGLIAETGEVFGRVGGRAVDVSSMR